jgi:hypothetical protein
MNLNHNHYICLWSFFKSDCLNWSADDVPSSNTEESNPLFIGLKPDSIYYLSGSCPDRVVKFSTCFLIRVKFQCLPKSNITVGLIWVNLGWFSFRMIVEEKTWNILLFIYSYKPTTIMNRGHCFWTYLNHYMKTCFIRMSQNILFASDFKILLLILEAIGIHKHP